MNKTTVTAVDLDEVLQHIGFTPAEIDTIRYSGLKHVSYGDAVYTLVTGRDALQCILAGSWFLNTSMDEDAVAMRFWEVVGEYDYVNLEREYLGH